MYCTYVGTVEPPNTGTNPQILGPIIIVQSIFGGYRGGKVIGEEITKMQAREFVPYIQGKHCL